MQCTGKFSAAGTIQILMSVNLNVQSPVLAVSYECGTMFCAAETWNYLELQTIHWFQIGFQNHGEVISDGQFG